jgi:hypothetical protein
MDKLLPHLNCSSPGLFDIYMIPFPPDGELLYEVPATSLDDATGAHVPTEPSYIIFNTAGAYATGCG